MNLIRPDSGDKRFSYISYNVYYDMQLLNAQVRVPEHVDFFSGRE